MTEQEDLISQLWDTFASAQGVSREVPQARRCASQRELADWFMQFARACRSVRHP